MASNSSPSQPAPQNQTPPQTQTPLTLPAPASSSSSAASTQATTQTSIAATGDTVALDHLGPMVVNHDGTLSRIANWADMSEIERQNTMRVLGKRNQARMRALEEKEKENAAQS